MLDVRGQVQIQDSIRLDAADEPMLVRQSDVMTSGAKQGFGRWGMYMEPTALFLGIPGTDGPSGSIRFGGWLADGRRQDRVTINKNAYVGIEIDQTPSRLTVAGVVESTTGGFKFPDGTVQGTAASSFAGWSLTGNAGTLPGTHFVGTTDNQALL